MVTDIATIRTNISTQQKDLERELDENQKKIDEQLLGILQRPIK